MFVLNQYYSIVRTMFHTRVRRHQRDFSCPSVTVAWAPFRVAWYSIRFLLRRQIAEKIFLLYVRPSSSSYKLTVALLFGYFFVKLNKSCIEINKLFVKNDMNISNFILIPVFHLENNFYDSDRETELFPACFPPVQVIVYMKSETYLFLAVT